MVEIKINIKELLKRSGMRLEVLKFALEMEKFMMKNDKRKGDSWKEMRVRDLLDHLDIEMDELRFEMEEMDVKAVQKVLVDTANYCMMAYTILEERKQ